MKRKLKFSGRFALTSVAASLLLASPLASALGLGRLSVQSALGEVLRAEIEVTSLTAEEQAAQDRLYEYFERGGFVEDVRRIMEHAGVTV